MTLKGLRLGLNNRLFGVDCGDGIEGQASLRFLIKQVVGGLEII